LPRKIELPIIEKNLSVISLKVYQQNKPFDTYSYIIFFHSQDGGFLAQFGVFKLRW
jgi:hypothetical protein